MTATLAPVAARLDRSVGHAVSQTARAPQAGLLLASLVLVWVPAVLLGGAVNLAAALGIGALLVAAFLVSHARRRVRSQRIAATRTRGVLETAAGTGAVHGWVEGLALPEGTLGHLVLNPAGAFVVSSTWHGLGLSDTALHHDATAVSAAAAAARDLLRSRGIETVVRPVVAVWGAADADLPRGGVESGAVLTLRGSELGDLLAWTATHGGTWSHARAADLMLDLRDVPAADTALVLTSR